MIQWVGGVTPRKNDVDLGVASVDIGFLRVTISMLPSRAVNNFYIILLNTLSTLRLVSEQSKSSE